MEIEVRGPAAPQHARRRFKLANDTPTGWQRNLVIPVAAFMLIATLVVVVPSTGLARSPSQRLTNTALQYISAASALARSGATAAGSASPSDAKSSENDGDWPCRESGYCSVGKLEAYVGEVDSLAGFKAAINASCYKKECIILTIGTNGHLLGLNFVMGAWKLGLANVMLHAANNESCTRLANVGYANVTCVWSDRAWFPKGGKWQVPPVEELWAVRYILMARAVWLGFNVWLLDTDSYLYQDPYKYITVPPFSEISWMSLRDSGPIVNGGSSYIHNALAGGPAAWTIASMVDRMLRVAEQWEWYAHAAHIRDLRLLGRSIMDQFVLSDVVAGNRLHHPFIHFTLPAPFLAKDLHERLQYDSPGVQLQYPPDWHALTGSDEGHTAGFNMTISYLNGTWDEEIGGRRFPPRGNYSLAFIKVGTDTRVLHFQSGCDRPMLGMQMLEEESGVKFADIEGPTPSDYVPQNETFIFTPGWLLAAWLHRGIGGWWDLKPPLQVMVHALFIPGHGHAPWRKEYILKASGAFNFEIAQALQGQLFPTATTENPLPRVLALSPQLKLPSNTAYEYRDKLVQLVRLANRVGRVLLVPDPVCDSPWLGGPREMRPPIFGHNRSNYDIEQLLTYGFDDDQHCIWWHVVDPTCMPGRYIVHPDYKAFLRLLPEGTDQPAPDNTVHLGALEPGQGQDTKEKAQASASEVHARTGSPVSTPQPGAQDTVQRRTAEQQQGEGPSLAAAAKAAEQKAEPHILFLDAIPDLTPGGWPEEGETDQACGLEAAPPVWWCGGGGNDD